MWCNLQIFLHMYYISFVQLVEKFEFCYMDELPGISQKRALNIWTFFFGSKFKYSTACRSFYFIKFLLVNSKFVSYPEFDIHIRL